MMGAGDDRQESELQHEWEFFVYDEDDARYSLWLQLEDSGMALYDRPPEGHGMWLSPERDSDYDPVRPSSELKDILARLVAQEEVETADVLCLEPHERHFVQVVHGTVNENPDGVPDPVWSWMWDCHDERVASEVD